MVEEMLAARGIEVSYETLRRAGDQFGVVLIVLMQSRRDGHAAQRLMC